MLGDGPARSAPAGGSLPPMEIPERIEVKGGSVLVLTWPDGTVTTLAAPELRSACQCATCLAHDGTPPGMGDAAAVQILDTVLVGAYALSFTFAPDDHHTGIYPFDRLRSLGRSAGGTA